MSLECFVLGFLYGICTATPVVFIHRDRSGATIMHPPMSAANLDALKKAVGEQIKGIPHKFEEKSPEYIKGRIDESAQHTTPRSA